LIPAGIHKKASGAQGATLMEKNINWLNLSVNWLVEGFTLQLGSNQQKRRLGVTDAYLYFG
jgi:hypothetical protein